MCLKIQNKYWMKLEFTSVTDILYSINCDEKPILDQIFLQLPTAPWLSCAPADGNTKNAVDIIDYNNNALLSTEMQTFESWCYSRDFKQQILNLLFANSEFMNEWGQPRRELFDKLTRVSAGWVRTPPNYNACSWHIDNRSQVAFGMIYFIQGDDPRQSTYFDTELKKIVHFETDPFTPYQRIPTGVGRGWFVINHGRARHYAFNDTDQYRHCLKFSLNLNTV